MVTMQDIADSVKVSRGTVSYVLNGKHKKAKISETTKDQILIAAEKMGYRRNAVAQSMKTGKTNMVAFIGWIGQEYVMKIIQGINKELAERGYTLKMMSLEWSYNDIAQIARKCVEQMADGVICMGLRDDHFDIVQKELKHHNIPIVLVDNNSPNSSYPRILSDDINGEIIAVKHLAELGHRRIGHITIGPCGFVELRKAGFIEGMRECGLECTEDNFAYVDNFFEVTEEIYAAFDSFMQSFAPTAITFASDNLAMKFLQWAYMRGIKVPDDISIVGFANLDLTTYSSPALTTIGQPFKQMGAAAASRIIDLISNDPAKEHVPDEKLPVKLIIRNSTKKLINNEKG